MPVLLATVRWMTIAFSFFVRKMIFLGESGSRKINQKTIPAVMVPRARKSNCQLLTAGPLAVPMP